MTYSHLKNEIMQSKLTTIFDDLGVFFAFSDKQFNEGLKKIEEKKENITAIHAGGFIPSKNVKEYIKRSDNLLVWLRAEVKKLDPENVIEYELSNYESYYTGDISTAFEALADHGFTRDQVKAVYNKNYDKHN